MNGPVQVFDGSVTPDGFTVNTLQAPYQPSGIAPAEGGDLALADPSKAPVPPQSLKTVGDTLSAKGISWAWYAGGWNAAVADGRRPPSEKRNVIYNTARGELAFQPHHQPFNYYARFAPGTADREQHLKDYDDFAAAIDAGKLPAVSFYKPVGRLNQHPSYTDLAQGDAHIDAVLTRLRASPLWPKMLVIVTYDENGGYWDHMPPPQGTRLGRPLGAGHARAGADRLAVRQARLRRQDLVRHDVDHQVDHAPLCARAFARRAREGRRPDERARLLAALIAGGALRVQRPGAATRSAAFGCPDRCTSRQAAALVDIHKVSARAGRRAVARASVAGFWPSPRSRPVDCAAASCFRAIG